MEPSFQLPVHQLRRHPFFNVRQLLETDDGASYLRRVVEVGLGSVGEVIVLEIYVENHTLGCHRGLIRRLDLPTWLVASTGDSRRVQSDGCWLLRRIATTANLLHSEDLAQKYRNFQIFLLTGAAVFLGLALL